MIVPATEIFDTLFTGHIKKRNLTVSWNSQELDLPLELNRKIETFWKQLKRNSNADTILFDGIICRLDNYLLRENTLHLWLRKTYYRHTLFCNEHPIEVQQKWGNIYLCNTLGVSAVVKTRDNNLLLMRRSKNVGEYPEFLDVFGGHINPLTDLEDNIPSPFLAIQNELCAELGIIPGDIANLDCIGMVKNRQNFKPELIFAAHILRSTEEILDCASHAEESNEYTDLIYFCESHKSLHNFLTENRNYITPSAYGSLWLYAVSECYW